MDEHISIFFDPKTDPDARQRVLDAFDFFFEEYREEMQAREDISIALETDDYDPEFQCDPEYESAEIINSVLERLGTVPESDGHVPDGDERISMIRDENMRLLAERDRRLIDFHTLRDRFAQAKTYTDIDQETLRWTLRLFEGLCIRFTLFVVHEAKVDGEDWQQRVLTEEEQLRLEAYVQGMYALAKHSEFASRYPFDIGSTL